MKRGNVRELLLGNDVASRYAGSDRGIDWVSDKFVLARADVFARPVAWREALKSQTIRKVLTRARTDVAPTLALDTVHRLVNDPESEDRVALIGTSYTGPYIGVNANLWEAWRRTGLSPAVSCGGRYLLWFGTVRGKRTLFAVVMPMIVRQRMPLSAVVAALDSSERAS